MIALIDYGSGNLRSVGQALTRVGAEVRLAATPAGLDGASAVVLPGVGSFGDSVRNLHEHKLFEPLKTWILEGKPFFGICLGYQLLFSGSEESPGIPGLGVFPGAVRKFKSSELKIPHMGWNTLRFRQPRHPVWEGLNEGDFVYFVHSFYPEPEEKELIAATCDYGVDFAACISRDRLVATQFHPEKSQETGLRILENFVKLYA